jgi:hypothetical protein
MIFVLCLVFYARAHMNHRNNIHYISPSMNLELFPSLPGELWNWHIITNCLETKSENCKNYGNALEREEMISRDLSILSKLSTFLSHIPPKRIRDLDSVMRVSRLGNNNTSTHLRVLLTTTQKLSTQFLTCVQKEMHTAERRLCPRSWR